MLLGACHHHALSAIFACVALNDHCPKKRAKACLGKMLRWLLYKPLTGPWPVGEYAAFVRLGGASLFFSWANQLELGERVSQAESDTTLALV